uniref:integrase core domain-containing protein n=1 Tax=Paramuribaculum intestinale TaxID=2094151 RepID=UPI0025B23A08
RRRHARISMMEGHDPRNNGIAERVNGILKEEFLKHMDVRKDNIRQVLEDVINTYHTRRPHLSLGMLTPDEVHRGAVPGRTALSFKLK